MKLMNPEEVDALLLKQRTKDQLGKITEFQTDDKKHARERRAKQLEQHSELVAKRSDPLRHVNTGGGETETATASNTSLQLPKDWRDEHWKTIQSLAEEFAGVEASNKAEAVEALEAYEAAQLREMI